MNECLEMMKALTRRPRGVRWLLIMKLEAEGHQRDVIE